MIRHYHTIILGMGAMGAAAAYHLSRRQLPVLGLDQSDIPNALGSSHGQSRLIRLAYYEHPDYVPLLRRSYALWRELEQQSGQKLLHITGGLYIGAPDDELLTGSLASARRHQLPYEMLSPDQTRARFPQFHLDHSQAAFFEPEAGVLLPEMAIAAHVAGALQHGAEVHAHEPALDWSATAGGGGSGGGGVTVRTAHRTYHAEHLVITAGPWTSQLLPFLNEKLTVTRQPMLWFWPKAPAAFSLGQFPSWCLSSGHGGLIYGPPMLPGETAPLGLKVSHHFPGAAASPETLIRTPLPQDAEAVRAALARHLPEANGPLLGHRVCMYTNSPDHHFVIDHHPRHRNVTIAAGFSGHGFKFSAVVGEVLADLAATGVTPHPIAFLSLSRF